MVGLVGYFTIRHKPRPHGAVCTDETEWLVLEQSPSFYIVQPIQELNGTLVSP